MEKQQKLEKDGVIFTPVSSRTMVVSFPSMNYTATRDIKKNSYKSLSYNDTSINLGDSFYIKLKKNDIQVKYKANYISSYSDMHDVKDFFVMEGNINKTTMFILPLLFETRISASYVQQNSNGTYYGYLINAYIDCCFIEKKSPYSVFLLTKFIKSDNYKKTEEYFKQHDCFVKTHDFSKDYVIYEFIIKAEFRDDFDKILEGKYSKISKKAKGSIIKFHKDNIEGSITSSILNRDPEFIKKIEEDFDVPISDDMEVYSKFDHEEILTIDML